MSKYKAVIFDVFGTLVDNFSFREHEKILYQMANVLCVPPDDFACLWVKTFPERVTGFFPTIEDNIREVSKYLTPSIELLPFIAYKNFYGNHHNLYFHMYFYSSRI